MGDLKRCFLSQIGSGFLLLAAATYTTQLLSPCCQAPLHPSNTEIKTPYAVRQNKVPSGGLLAPLLPVRALARLTWIACVAAAVVASASAAPRRAISAPRLWCRASGVPSQRSAILVLDLIGDPIKSSLALETYVQVAGGAALHTVVASGRRLFVTHGRRRLARLGRLQLSDMLSEAR